MAPASENPGPEDERMIRESEGQVLFAAFPVRIISFRVTEQRSSSLKTKL
jgi:hypothetical protein